MTQLTTSPVLRKRTTKSPTRLLAERLFYPLSAVLILAITLYGFKDFFFHGKAFPDRPLTAAIRTLLIVHGIAQLGWILLFIVQPTMIALRKHKVHMMIGRIGAVFALVLVVLGYMVGVGAARANPPDMPLFGMLPPQFLYVPLTAIGVFGAMVAVAVWKRKKPDIHRSMMLIATVSVLSAAMGRINWINEMVVGTFWDRAFGPLHSSVTLGLILLAIRCAIVRRFDLWLAVSVAALALVYAVMLRVSYTPAWDAFARFLMG